MQPTIARSFVLQLLCTVFLVNAAAAQNSGPASKSNTPQERSVKVLTDVPDNTSPKPSMSAADLASLNLNVKSDNAAGLTLDIIPSGEVIAGS